LVVRIYDHNLPLEQPALSACLKAAAGGQQLFGDSAGKPALRLLLSAGASTKSAPKLCAQVRGVNIHASARVPGTDRLRLERLCRYAARPPLSQERLYELPDGRLRLELKKPWADGTTALVLEPLDFIARLVAAIPPPRFHMLRFHGVLAPHCALRPLVVPKPATAVPIAPLELALFEPPVASTPAVVADAESKEPRYKGRHPWSLLLRHAFAVDVTACAHCKGRMRLLQLCTTPAAIAPAMARAGLGARPPPPPPPPPRQRVHASQLRLPLP